MPFKNEYLTTVEVTPCTYICNGEAAERVRGIYSTARTGQISAELGSQLWVSFFAPLLTQLSALPATQADYDQFATDHILHLADRLRRCKKGDFGHAQKMFNLYLKDRWALNDVPTPFEILLHLPLDGIVLSMLTTIPPPWTAWTKVEITPNTQQYVVSAYLRIQWLFRAYRQRVAPRFTSPIEMEQFIWHKF